MLCLSLKSSFQTPYEISAVIIPCFTHRQPGVQQPAQHLPAGKCEGCNLNLGLCGPTSLEPRDIAHLSKEIPTFIFTPPSQFLLHGSERLNLILTCLLNCAFIQQ